MPDTPEKRPSHLDMPRSPVSCSTDSSRRDSLKHLQPEKDSEPPTPNSQSPPFRLTRKRAASIDTESANHPRIGDLALNSASSVGPRASDATREQVCLCQPDPKIPRPRNAFILYRQHYQAQVVTQNPGLANPEISKIIGEKWRETAPEVKNDWKRLAEEEKQRHQRQYPGYRYQPRRAGKPNGIKSLSSSSSDDPVRCPKCNGRYISTPSTPMTPFTPAFASTDSRNDRLLPPFTPGTSSHMEDMSRYSSQGMDTRMDSPRSGPVQPQTHRRGPYPPPQPLHTLREQNEDVNMSPEQKRRRFNEGPQRAYPSPSPISYTGPQTFPRNAPPMSASAYRSQQQFPGQGLFPRSASMAPPQQSPSFQQPRHPYPTRSNTFDESLRLPPLQTQLLGSAPVSTHRPELRPESRESQARSVEAMVMTIPYLNKIKVLSKISGPLPPPGPTSPARDIRGAVIAVEGADHALVSEIGAFLNEALGKEPSLAVKTWTAPPSSSNSPTTPGTDTEMTEDGVETTADNDHDPFVDYLTTISKWHKKSQAIQKHITSTPPSPPIDPGVTKRSSDSAPKRLPVALLPEGFSITTSDHFALRIPINDAYAPVDHWQWMATLWRGILGPDLTVYVKKIRDKEEFESMSGVELRKDCAAIVVRVMEGSKLDEKSARRLAFEVSESVRGAEGAFGRA